MQVHRRTNSTTFSVLAGACCTDRSIQANQLRLSQTWRPMRMYRTPCHCQGMANTVFRHRYIKVDPAAPAWSASKGAWRNTSAIMSTSTR